MGSFVLAGGGSGGHVNPLLATAAELTARGHSVVAVGTAEGLETELVPRAGVELRFVDRVPLPRRPNGAALTFPRDFSRATAQAAEIIKDTRADAVVGFGGYVSTPVYKAARKAGVPVVVHEANARPGFANKYGARFAAAVATTFAGTPLPGAVVTGLPLRREISDLAAAMADPLRRGDRRPRGARGSQVGPRRPRAARYGRLARRGEPQRRRDRGHPHARAPRDPRDPPDRNWEGRGRLAG
ncbi:MAG: glycosyltransferase [Demequina sp.]|nr:glycosyltransferase [Demequina sp.]